MKKKIKTALTTSKEFCIDVFGWCRSCLIWIFRPVKKSAIFYGFSVYWFASRYAERRDRRWRSRWDQHGKLQGIIPIADTKIIVCSRLELKLFQKAGMIKHGVNVNKMFKRSSYYQSKNNYKK